MKKGGTIIRGRSTIHAREPRFCEGKLVRTQIKRRGPQTRLGKKRTSTFRGTDAYESGGNEKKNERAAASKKRKKGKEKERDARAL